MSRNQRTLLGTLAFVVLLVVLVSIFPRAYAFAELAARELRYFWWLVLIALLAAWLIWGFGRKSGK